MAKEEKIVVYTDGGSRGNPGPAGIGVILSKEKGGILKEYSHDIGVRTNNEAEYEAVIFALQKIKHLFGKHKTADLNIEIRMDSELVARQLSGKYKIIEEKLFPLFIKVWNLRMDFGKINFMEIPREKNREADKLANQAMDKRETKPMF
jgi:ribonuclease HI